MNYIGNSAQDYFNHATKQISKLTRNMKEKVELKAQEVNSISGEIIKSQEEKVLRQLTILNVRTLF